MHKIIGIVISLLLIQLVVSGIVITRQRRIKQYGVKLILLFSFFLFGCSESQVKKNSKYQSTKSSSASNFDYLYTKLEGQRYPYKPGTYKRNKTVSFFVHKENSIFQDELVTVILADHKLLAKDSIDLKTVVLIYSNTLPIKRLIEQESTMDKDGFQICFVDIDSMCVRKVVSLKNIRKLPGYKEIIGTAIAENF